MLTPKYDSQIKSIAIIAEGVPERRAREILHVAKKRGITIIGPATYVMLPEMSLSGVQIEL